MAENASSKSKVVLSPFSSGSEGSTVWGDTLFNFSFMLLVSLIAMMTITYYVPAKDKINNLELQRKLQVSEIKNGKLQQRIEKLENRNSQLKVEAKLKAEQFAKLNTEEKSRDNLPTLSVALQSDNSYILKGLKSGIVNCNSYPDLIRHINPESSNDYQKIYVITLADTPAQMAEELINNLYIDLEGKLPIVFKTYNPKTQR